MARIGQTAVDYIILVFEDRDTQVRITEVRVLAEISDHRSFFPVTQTGVGSRRDARYISVQVLIRMGDKRAIGHTYSHTRMKTVLGDCGDGCDLSALCRPGIKK